jgi:two-component sensor histidine kinase
MLRDWFPWMLLSPVVVIVAELFRFDRQHWLRTLTVHLITCALVALGYESLLILNLPEAPGPFVSAGPFPLRSVNLGPAPLSTNDSIAGFTATHSTNFTFPVPPPRMRVINTRLDTNGSAPTDIVFNQIDAVPLTPLEPPTNNVTYSFGTPAFSAGTVNLSTAKLEVFTMAGGIGGMGMMWLSPHSPWKGLVHRASMRLQFTTPIYLCIVCLCWVLNHFQEARERERRAAELEQRLMQANLQALKMQLQPHFLFNTLNAISSLVHENPQAADDMICSLSNFLRMSLEVSSQNEVPLQRELDFVDRYLEIQQTRFGERLHVQQHIAPDVKDALVPPLILQPLVENSIRHGLEAREHGGVITLQAFRRTEWLHLEITDDGEGFKNTELWNASEGIGLSNTKARLTELYGANHTFRLAANHPSGACVIIEIPFRLADNQPLSNS